MVSCLVKLDCNSGNKTDVDMYMSIHFWAKWKKISNLQTNKKLKATKEEEKKKQQKHRQKSIRYVKIGMCLCIIHQGLLTVPHLLTFSFRQIVLNWTIYFFWICVTSCSFVLFLAFVPVYLGVLNWTWYGMACVRAWAHCSYTHLCLFGVLHVIVCVCFCFLFLYFIWFVHFAPLSIFFRSSISSSICVFFIPCIHLLFSLNCCFLLILKRWLNCWRNYNWN